jgi:hypothetical protein
MILTGDTLHAWRIHELGRCLDDGQVPCRWVPDLGNGYGFPLFNYYPPLPYYAGDLLNRLGLSYLATVDMLFVVGLLGAGLSMYVLGRRLWGTLGGIVSATFYVYAPYLALDVYLRGALAELWALAIVPALLWSIYELITTEQKRWIPVVALFAGLLLLSHNLVSMIVLPAVALWAVVLLLTRGRRAWRPAAMGAAAGVWGIGLAAFFTLPVLSEGLHVQLESVSRWPFHYSDHFVSVNDLFLLRTNDYTFLLGLRDGTPVQIGWLHWAIAGLSVPAGVIFWRRGQRVQTLAIALFAAFFAFGVYMTLSVSEGIWDSFDSLRYIQFPWRYMGLVSLGAAGLAGAWVAVLQPRPVWQQAVVAGAMVAAVIAMSSMFFEPVYRLNVDDADVFSGEFYELYQAGSITDYLPDDVEVIPPPASTPVEVVAGEAQVRFVDSGTDWLRMRVDAEGPARVQASLFNYPEWQVQLDGQPIAHRASKPSGLVTFTVPSGAHHVEIQLEDTEVRRSGNRISLVSWLAMAAVVPAMIVGPWARRLSKQRRDASET